MGRQDDFPYRHHKHLYSSFLMGYLMKNITTIVNHELILYSMSFLLTWIIHVFSTLIYTSGYLCCSIQSTKARNPGKYCSTSSTVLSLLVLLYISFVELVGIVLSRIQSFGYLCIRYFDLGQVWKVFLHQGLFFGLFFWISVLSRAWYIFCYLFVNIIILSNY